MSIALVSAPPLVLSFGSGCSEIYHVLQAQLRNAQRHSEQSYVLGWREELRNQLVESVREGSIEGWDGYGAKSVTPLAIATAEHIINLLPETSLPPDIVPTPSGEIAFEWHCGNDYLFSLVTHQGLLIYAGLLGPERKQHGQEPLGDTLPQTIETILETYFSKS